MLRARVLVAAVLVAACAKQAPSVVGDDGTAEPKWRFVRQTLPVSDVTLTGIYGNDEGELYVVGWGGVILRFKDELWTRMASPTGENLTAITGVANGAAFGLPASRGTMLAVGWHGTLLHFHPNPDGDPLTDDGAWVLVAGPEQPFAPAFKPDPMCPDFDGDGVADDGDGDGWWGNVGGAQVVCAAGLSSGCDDNCVETANGSQRPIADTNAADSANAGCVGPGDLPDLSKNQVDLDGDGIGLVCDNDDNDGDPAVGQQTAYDFAPTFFDVWMRWNGTDMTAMAVGEHGAVVSFVGPPLYAPGLPSALEDRAGWIAQINTPFRYVNDCPPSTPAGTVCSGSGRLPPSCPAQCHPRKTSCSCPVGGGQCCDPAGGLTGAGCADGSCGPAANACTGGSCSTLCPGCFRRLEETLRGIEVVGDTIIGVGARGTIVFGNAASLYDVWSAPNCLTPPPPLDENPVLTAVGGAAGAFHAVGAAGAIFRVGVGGECPIESRPRAPQGFFSAVLATSASSAFAVGDQGLFVQVNGSPDAENNYVEVIETPFSQHLLALWRTYEPPNPAGERPPRYWLVGAGGTIVKAGVY